MEFDSSMVIGGGGKSWSLEPYKILLENQGLYFYAKYRDYTPPYVLINS